MTSINSEDKRKNVIFVKAKDKTINFSSLADIPKKALKTIFQIGNENKGKIYGAVHTEKLKGGIIYKIYHEIVSPEKISKEPKYVKLVFPDKSEIEVSPLTGMETALKKSRDVWMARYEFEVKMPHNNYLYIFKVGDYYFDLPEKMAKEILDSTGIKLHTYS